MKSERFHLGTTEILVGADAEETVRIAAGQFAAAVRKVSSAGKPAFVAFPGGGEARQLFLQLAEEPFAGIIPWDGIRFFWVDERNVPPGDAESNYGMAREALLSRVPVPAANIHRIPTGDGTAIEAAELYQRTLQESLPVKGGLPRFDYVLLGLGAEGHTASLFPHRPSLREEHRLVVAAHVDEVGSWRVTLTAPVLNHAAHVTFFAMGEEKAAAVQRTLVGARDAEEIPAQLIAPSSGSLSWMLDAPAAMLVPRPALAAEGRQMARGRAK
jgi:6-phosphogluconolactonase